MTTPRPTRPDAFYKREDIEKAYRGEWAHGYPPNVRAIAGMLLAADDALREIEDYPNELSPEGRILRMKEIARAALLPTGDQP